MQQLTANVYAGTTFHGCNSSFVITKDGAFVIDTPMVQMMIHASRDPDKTRHKLAAQVPLGHIGEPDDVAWAIVYLASEESKFVTGAELVIDGGVTAM